MRLKTALLPVLAILAGLAPSHAAKALPRFAGTTTFTASWSNQAVLVTLPRAVTVDAQNPSSWIRVSTPWWQSYAGVLIDDVGHRGSADRRGLLFTRFGRPAGCDMALSCVPVDAIAVRSGASPEYKTPVTPTITLKPGTYRVYVFGSENIKKITMTMRGLSGATSITTTSPFNLNVSTENAQPTDDLAAHPESAGNGGNTLYPIRELAVAAVKRPALLVGGVWRTPGPSSSVSVAPAIASCWAYRAEYKGLPDYWWQNPDAILAFATPQSSLCTDQNSVGLQRVFLSPSTAGQWVYRYQVAPVTTLGQRRGAFAIALSFFDPQD